MTSICPTSKSYVCSTTETKSSTCGDDKDSDASKSHRVSFSNVLILVRGLPGSGKTTVAKAIASLLGYKHFEADHFFERDGEYKFDPELLGRAHAYCQGQVHAAMHRRKNIVVSNTFTTGRELEPYYVLARENGYQIQTIICRGEFGSVHNVPSETIERMRKRFDYYA